MEPNQVSGVAWTTREPPDGLTKGRRFAIADLGVFDLTEDGTGYDYFKPYDIDFKGRLIATLLLVDEVTTDTNADGLIETLINGVEVTGGDLTVADKNDGSTPVDPVNTFYQGTAVTDDNEVIPGDTVSLEWTTTNVFSDGKVRVLHVYETETA
jgi:hypothetical protein